MYKLSDREKVLGLLERLQFVDTYVDDMSIGFAIDALISAVVSAELAYRLDKENDRRAP